MDEKGLGLTVEKEHGYVLTPGRYVGAAEIEDDGVPFEEKMTELAGRLYGQMRESGGLDEVIKRLGISTTY